jgi:hypothetical protein
MEPMEDLSDDDRDFLDHYAAHDVDLVLVGQIEHGCQAVMAWVQGGILCECGTLRKTIDADALRVTAVCRRCGEVRFRVCADHVEELIGYVDRDLPVHAYCAAGRPLDACRQAIEQDHQLVAILSFG